MEETQEYKFEYIGLWLSDNHPYIAVISGGCASCDFCESGILQVTCLCKHCDLTIS